MSEELISKKELLEVMNISYGQLYRWKRKNLIPEEWFIKKSVSTGQETFFPKEEIIERVNIILELKDDVSLDELASKFTYNINDINIKIKREYLIRKNIVPQSIIERFEAIIPRDEVYNQSKVFALLIYNDLLQVGLLSLDEVNEITLAVLKNYSQLQNVEYSIMIKRKLGVCIYYVIQGDADIIEDKNAVLVTIVSIKELLEKINQLK